MVEPNDTTSEAQELSLHRRIVGHEDRGTVKDFRSVRNDLDSGLEPERAPELSNGGVTGVPVAQHTPPSTLPALNQIREALEVVPECGGGFWNPGVECIPVECDGDRVPFRVSSVSGVPVIEAWRSDNGRWRYWVTGKPAHSDVSVGADEATTVVMARATAVGPACGNYTIRLPGPVFDVEVWHSGGSLYIGVTGNEQQIGLMIPAPITADDLIPFHVFGQGRKYRE